MRHDVHDRQSCCNTGRRTTQALRSFLRQHGGVRACEHRRNRGSDSPRRLAGERRVLLVSEGTLRYPDGFKAVAVTLYECAQNARVDSEQSDAWFLPPPDS